MQIRFERRALRKRYPLKISRGVTFGSENLYIRLTQDGIEGWGEAAPGGQYDEELLLGQEDALRELFEAQNWTHLSEIIAEGRRRAIPAPALAALDIAWWDLRARRCGEPLTRFFGLSLPTEPTSVTIGINPPEVIRERVPEILQRTGGRALKIKLGNPEGIEADQAAYAVARECAAPFAVRLRVDANGGWSLADARAMMAWLAERDCDYVEQPLAEGQEEDLKGLADRPLPIFVDESCHVAADVDRVARLVDGVNLKLMKSGGILEGLKLLARARAHGLQTMIGCMGESSISISAAASISGLIDHIDLDSQLNLDPDPAVGAAMVNGVVVPPATPGHGGRLR